MSSAKYIFFFSSAAAAISMAALIAGLLYFMLKVVPDMQEAMRKVYFVEKRRELRKKRAKAKRLKERGY